MRKRQFFGFAGARADSGGVDKNFHLAVWRIVDLSFFVRDEVGPSCCTASSPPWSNRGMEMSALAQPKPSQNPIRSPTEGVRC